MASPRPTRASASPQRPLIHRMDRYDQAAADMLPSLTQDRLAELLRQNDALTKGHDTTLRQQALIISALLELLGGHAFLPEHALKDARGFEATPGARAGDLHLTVPSGDSH